jgi:hypothetical protein
MCRKISGQSASESSISQPPTPPPPHPPKKTSEYGMEDRNKSYTDVYTIKLGSFLKAD